MSMSKETTMSQGKPGSAVGYVHREVPACERCAEPHRHIKIGLDYFCEHALAWCPRCGVPRAVSKSECRSCRHLGG